MKTIEFGIILQGPTGPSLNLIPVDGHVQGALDKMFTDSAAAVSNKTPEPYQLAEKYSDAQCATLGYGDPLTQQIRDIYEATNLKFNVNALGEIEKIRAYFSAVSEDGKPKLLGIRQATQFKTLHKKPILRLAAGQLGLEPQPLFKLDERWDLITDGQSVTILSATALERICDLTPEIRKAAVDGLATISPAMPYLSIEPLQKRVEGFTRSARIVADLQRRDDLASVTMPRLQSESQRQAIEYQVVDGKYIVKVGSEEGLLMLLDRKVCRSLGRG